VTIGAIKFFNAAKGFGFIRADGGGSDMFIRISAVERTGMQTIVDGQKLGVDVMADGPGGRNAAGGLRAA
jgi:CspA family cold shock protein